MTLYDIILHYITLYDIIRVKLLEILGARVNKEDLLKEGAFKETSLVCLTKLLKNICISRL